MQLIHILGLLQRLPLALEISPAGQGAARWRGGGAVVGEARREGGKGPRLVAAAEEEDRRRCGGAKGTGEEERVIGCSTCGGEGFGGSGVIDRRD